MNKKDKFLTFEILLCLLVKFFIYFITWKYYSLTYNADIIQMAITMWIVTSLINWKKERKIDNKLRKFTFVLLISVLMIFFFTKPNITFNQGRDILKNNGYYDINEFKYRSVVTKDFDLKVNRYNAYLYSGYKNGEESYLLISPKTGEFLEEEIGSESYLDDYVK